MIGLLVFRDEKWLKEDGSLSSWWARMQHSNFKPLNIDLYDRKVWTDPIELLLLLMMMLLLLLLMISVCPAGVD